MPASERPQATPANSGAVTRGDGIPGALPTYVTAARHGPLVRARKWLVDAMVAQRSRQARRILEAKPELWALMTQVAAGTAVTGASYSDYLTLYAQVRAHRPREILECGTGISTVVLAQALRENAIEDGETPGRVTSMEDDADWYRTACVRLP